MKKFPQRATGSFAVSVAIHMLLAVVLGSIVFRYPLGQLVGIIEPDTPREQLRFVTLPPRPTEGSVDRPGTPESGTAPAALQAPALAPAEIPAPIALDSARSRAAGAEGEGSGVTGSGYATGLVPRLPDSRIALTPGAIIRTPRGVSEDVDSIVSLAVGIYMDSVAIAAGRRRPGDWTVEGKDGQKWGWDQAGIRLGKFTIPNALLALLPLNVGAGRSPIEVRSDNAIRRDVMENAQRSVSEDEFNAAVKRIRERKERERREKQLAADGKPLPATP